MPRKQSEPVHTGPLTEATKKLLRGYVSEIERTEDEIDVLKENLKGIYDCVLVNGLDVAVVKRLIKERKQPAHQLELFEETKAAYRLALKRWSQADREKVAEAAKSVARASMIDRPFAPPLDQPAGIPVIEELMQLGRKN